MTSATPPTPSTPAERPGTPPPTSATPAAPTSQPPQSPPPSPVLPFALRLPWAVRWAALAVAILIVLFLLRWTSYRFSHSITIDAFVEAHIVNVAPEMVAGRIVRLLVEENDKVAAGQVLAEIEPIHYQDQVAQCAAHGSSPRPS